MKFLLDTHLLIWLAEDSPNLPAAARDIVEDDRNLLYFSAASLWEISIKRQLGRDDFQVDPMRLYRGLIDNDYTELSITASHTIAVDALPPLHKDPFDRILVAQARVEGITLLTMDSLVARYPGPIRLL